MFIIHHFWYIIDSGDMAAVFRYLNDCHVCLARSVGAQVLDWNSWTKNSGRQIFIIHKSKISEL